MWHPMLKRLLKGWGRKGPDPSKDPRGPMGLTPDQVASLRQVVGSPNWGTYSLLLERVGEGLLTEVLSGLTHEQYLAKCGEIRMLARLMELPRSILDKVTDREDRENVQSIAASTAADRRAAGFANTPYWDAIIRDTAQRRV